MSPYARIALIEHDFRYFRHRVYMLVIAGFVLIGLGLGITFWSYFTSESDVQRSTCQNSQTLLTQYEWFKQLAVQNTQHLPQSDVQQRVDFYNRSEKLIPTDACEKGIGEMRKIARAQIQRLAGELPQN